MSPTQSSSLSRWLPSLRAATSVLTAPLVARLAALVALALFAAPGSAAGPLVTVPEPDMSGVDAQVGRQIAERFAATRVLGKDATDAERGAAFGELGKALLHYQFLDAAQAALYNARTLQPDEIPWSYYAAVTAERRGEIEEAASLLQNVLSVREGNLPAVLRLADVLLSLGRLDEALHLYEAATQSPLGVPAGRAGLGRIAMERGAAREAIGHFEAALEAQPQATALQYQLGLAHREAGDLEKARELMAAPGGREVAYPDPLMIQLAMGFESPGERRAAAAVAAQQGDMEAAVKELEGLVRESPDDVDIRRSLARGLERIGSIDAAIDQWRELLRRAPDDADAHASLGMLSIRRSGDPNAGVDSLRRAIELDPDFYEAYDRLGLALLQLGRAEEALPYMRKQVEMQPRNEVARRQLAQTFYGLGRLDEALGEIDAILAQAPDDHDARILRGRILGAHGRPTEAEAEFQRVAAVSSATLAQRAEALYNSALLDEASLEVGEAVAGYQKVLALDPKHVPTLRRMADILVRAGQNQGATEMFRRLWELDSTNAEFRYLLAQSMAREGSYASALGHFDALRRDRPQIAEYTIQCAAMMAALDQRAEAEKLVRDALFTAEEGLAKGRLLAALADLQIDADDFEAGFASYRRALEAAPDLQMLHRRYAEVLARQGRWDESIDHYDQYIAAAPDDEQAHFQRAVALLLAHRWSDAKERLLDITSRRPDVGLTHMLARLLATAPDDSVRDGERAVGVAEAVFGAERSPVHGETLAMAMAAAGRFEEALTLQRRLLEEAEAAEFDPGFIERVRANLARYEAGQIAQSEW